MDESVKVFLLSFVILACFCLSKNLFKNLFSGICFSYLGKDRLVISGLKVQKTFSNLVLLSSSLIFANLI